MVRELFGDSLVACAADGDCPGGALCHESADGLGNGACGF
jgi:hypothetical protein